METTSDLPQDAIISVLAHLHPRPASSSQIHSPIINETDYLADQPSDDDDISNTDTHQNLSTSLATPASPFVLDDRDHDISRWPATKLRTEVIRLRGILRDLGQDVTPPDSKGKKRKRRETDQTDIVDAADGQQQEETAQGSSMSARREKERKKVIRDQETGKRVDKGRRLELGKAIRAKMRFSMGIGEKDRLPPPSYFSAETTDQLPELAGYGVPNWLSPMDESSVMWVERMAAEILEESANGQHPEIPIADLDPEIVKASSRTAFMNFCRKYIAETDPGRADKKARHQKGRRRWARKDLKQKKRAKAAADPSFTLTIPSTALHLDYMSSEYSSAGEETEIDAEEPMSSADLADKERRKAARAQRWREAIAVKVESMPEGERHNYGTFGFAQGDKVLEVRKPRWRSDELGEIYDRLDEIAAYHSITRSGDNSAGATMMRKGHIAPTNSRFTMGSGLKRRGKAPRESGVGWMWKSGRVGVWPQSEPVQSTQMDGVEDEQEADTGGWRESDTETGALVHALEGMTETEAGTEA